MEEKIKDPERDERFDESFDLMGFVLECLSKWPWFVASAIVCVGACYFYLSRQIPTYQVSALIYLNPETVEGANSLSVNTDNPLLGLKGYIDQSDMEIMKSANNLIQIVDSLDLAYSYQRKGRMRNVPIYGEYPVVARLDSVSLHNLRSPINITVKSTGDSARYDVKVKSSFRGITDTKTYDAIELPIEVELPVGTLTLTENPMITPLAGTLYINVNNPRNVAKALAGSLNVEVLENAFNIMSVTLSTPVIEEGIDVEYALLDFYNKQIIEAKNRSAIQTEAFILERLVGIADELSDVEQRLQDYRQRHNIADLHLQATLNLNQRSDNETQLAEVDAELQIIQSIENIVSNTDSYQSIPSVTNNSALTQIIEAYNKKVAQYNRSLEHNTVDNPLMSGMRDDLNRDKMRILQNIATVKNNLQSRKNAILALDRQSSSQLANLPPVDKGMQEIFREQQVKVNIYTFLLQRREEIALQKTMATAPARLIDDPVGYGPVSPRKAMSCLVALIIGLLLPAGYIYLRRLFFPVFKDQAELERLTPVPVIAEICNARRVPENEIVVHAHDDSSVAELFRLLRNNLNFAISADKKQVVLVTSAISGEGKTFVAINLAMTFALTGKRVVVVGMDIRRPVLSRHFGLSKSLGVTTYLSNQIDDVGSIVHQSKENENLYIVGAGPVPPNPNELLMNPRLDAFLDYLRENFDYVIIDSAPIGIISDTLLFTSKTDVQLFVTRADYSTRTCLRHLHTACNLNRLSSPYIVLNGVNITSSSYSYRRYGRYGHYGSKSYGYGYVKSGNNEHSKSK